MRATTFGRRTMFRKAPVAATAAAIAAAAALGAWPAAAAAAAGKPRIAVTAVTAEQVGAGVREKLEAAVAGGLAASGAEVIDGAETARRIADKGLAGCETSACLSGIAQATGAQYLVRGRVERLGRSYSVHLEMIDGASGAAVGTRNDRCEICTENEAFETASIGASSLKAEVSRRRAGARSDLAAPPRAPATAPAVLAVASPPGAGAGADSTVSSSPGAAIGAPGSSAGPRGRTWPWVGIGTGAIAVGAGIYLLSIDGRGTCDNAPGDPCPLQYQTKAGGITLMTVGVLAAALGAALLVGRF
jgi:hypothetical protein